jgi:small-conductance mechanosensitive channel
MSAGSVDSATWGALMAGGWVELQALIVLLVSLVGMRLALNWSGSAMRRGRVDLGTQILIKRGLLVAWLIVTLLVVLGILGVNPAGLVAVAGAVGLAFSLAIQDILKNFFSGVYLLLERPFRVGDTIRVKEQQGVVENVGVRTTLLRTRENVQVLVPNAVVFAEVVSNHTYARPADPSSQAEAEAEAVDGRTAEPTPSPSRDGG